MRIEVDDNGAYSSINIRVNVLVASEDFGDYLAEDNLVTYHLATAYDDGLRHSHVLRGDDLFEMTAPQLYLMEKLGLRPPEYTHIGIDLCRRHQVIEATHAPSQHHET